MEAFREGAHGGDSTQRNERFLFMRSLPSLSGGWQNGEKLRNLPSNGGDALIVLARTTRSLGRESESGEDESRGLNAGLQHEPQNLAKNAKSREFGGH